MLQKGAAKTPSCKISESKLIFVNQVIGTSWTKATRNREPLLPRYSLPESNTTTASS